MKICYLADAASIHTRKWVTFLRDQGNEIHLISLRKQNIPGVYVYTFLSACRPTAFVLKMNYLINLIKIRKLIKKISPDILHVHWASSYGFIAAFVKYHPYILSVWGSDITIFPKKSIFHKRILEFNLKNADILTCTSEFLSIETNKYINSAKKIYIIPFGIDLEKFYPQKKEKKDITIGFVKHLEKRYGIEYLIKAFQILYRKYPMVRLLVVGKGSMEKRLYRICENPELKDRVSLLGYIDHNSLPRIINQLDILAQPSIVPESFGVSILEAAACGIPVVASDIGGLRETVRDGYTGLFAKPKNAIDLAKKIEFLIRNKELRLKLGQNARTFVCQHYDWNTSCNKMLSLYRTLITNS